MGREMVKDEGDKLQMSKARLKWTTEGVKLHKQFYNNNKQTATSNYTCH